jgi:bifunctional non-homologous end joining protein LigD
MEELGLRGAVKTSGSSGIHIYIPLAPRTPLDAATLGARIIATRVAEKHPKEATVERMTKKRPRGTVYVDYLQNILGKSVAGVYAVRAKATPTVSTPLRWDDLTPDLDMREFTIDTVPDRVTEIGDVWARDMAKSNRLGDVVARHGGRKRA